MRLLERLERRRIAGEEVVSPDGRMINPNDALAVPLLFGQIDALRERVAYLTKCSELDAQPLPGNGARQDRMSPP